MSSQDTILRRFFDACLAGDLPRVLEAIATGELSADELDDGLKRATRMAHPDVVGALLDAGARVSDWTMASLPGNNQKQDPDVVRLFLDHGLDPNARVSDGEPLLPMLYSAACAREMLSRGADSNIMGPRGLSPLARAIVGVAEEDTSLFELYLEYGANLRTDPDLLFHAASLRVPHGAFKTRFLLSKGLNPNVTSSEMGTPLHMAIYSAKPEIVRLLLEAGADATTISIGRKNHGKSPKQVAEKVRHSAPREAILSLLELHEHRDVATSIGNTQG